MPSPADLFMENWAVGRHWSGPEVQNFVKPCVEFQRAVNESLLLPSANESYEALKSLQRGENAAVENGRILYILTAVDSFFEKIHPRTLSKSKLLEKLPMSHWLRKLVYTRMDDGAFASIKSHVLVPRGPLLRSARESFASSGYSFPDQFAFLSVVPTELSIEERPIQITTLVRDRSMSQGAGLAPSTNGTERVAFIPVAQMANHLLIEQGNQNGYDYVDFKLSDDVDAADVIDSVLGDIGYADIVMSAELMVDAAAADRLSPLIFAKPGRTRILMAGSGNTSDTQSNLPWNEARIFNGLGVELWRQRKIWQSGFDSARAADLGLSPSQNGRIMERNYAGDEVVVADIDGLGRCVVLICQDIKSKPLAPELLRYYQPDWVFVPIMDWGAGTTRWAHQYALDLSDISPARFLIASSLSMVEILKKDRQPCGLAIGPKITTTEDKGRECEAAYADVTPHGYGIVTWRTGWDKSAIGVEANKRKDEKPL